MEKILPIILIIGLVISITKCNTNKISMLTTQNRELEKASKENLSRIKQLEDSINGKAAEINSLIGEG